MMPAYPPRAIIDYADRRVVVENMRAGAGRRQERAGQERAGQERAGQKWMHPECGECQHPCAAPAGRQL